MLKLFQILKRYIGNVLYFSEMLEMLWSGAKD